MKSKYLLSQLDRFDKYKVYKMGGKGLLVTYNSNKAYLLGEKGYEEYFFD